MATISQQLVRRMNSTRTEMNDIAHNLSNASTPGFKRLMSTYQVQVESTPSAGQGGAKQTEVEYGLPRHIRRLDMQTGEMENTGRQLDLALEEPNGFFAVRTPSGLRYTRHGRFRVNTDGTIVNPAGHPLASKQGDFRVPPEAQNITVRSTGEILADGESVGNIPVYSFNDPGELDPDGGTLYDAGNREPQVTQTNSILQGMIEKSNVKPMNELVRLISTSRAYENSMRITKRLGDIKSSLIDRIA